MILWTIQPEAVFNLIQQKGVYRCDLTKSGMEDYAEPQYNWLVAQMKKRISPPPEGVSYPVWAYYRWSRTKMKPDLRAIRWFWGLKNNKFVRLEIEIPDDEVLLSDFDGWAGIILNNGLLSNTEEEDKELNGIYASLSENMQKEFRAKNWERVFDISYFENDWISRGETIQATFWELKKEQVRSYTSFVTEGKR